MNHFAKAASALCLMMLHASSAHACMARVERGDHRISAKIDPAREMPVEYSYQTGDLIMLSASKGMKVSVVTTPGNDEPSLKKLDVQDYERLTRDIPDSKLPMWDIYKKFPLRSVDWSHFVAGKAGVAFIKLQSGKKIDWIRVEVKNRPYVPPRVRKATELTQSDALTFMFHDSIEIELPGSLAVGWQVSAEKEVGMKLLSVADVSPERGYQPEGADAKPVERVRLRFVRGEAQSDTYKEKRLVIQGGGETFTFTVRQNPTPTC